MKLKNWKQMDIRMLEEEEKELLDAANTSDNKTWATLSLQQIFAEIIRIGEEILKKEGVKGSVEPDIWVDETLFISIFSTENIEEEKKEKISKRFSQSIMEALAPPRKPLICWK